MTTPADLPWARVHAVRARRHLLGGNGNAVPLVAATVADRLAGIQSQVDSTPALCLSARFPTAGAGPVAAALATPDLARLWAMRGTLHLVPTVDVHRYAAALGDAVAASQTRLWPRHGVAADAEDTVTTAVLDALAGGPLPRDALAAQVVARLGPAYGPLLSHPWGIGVKPAVARGLVLTELVDRVLVLRLAPPAVAAAIGTVGRADAQAWLAGRYLAANLVGTAASFAVWAGLPRAQARAALAAASDTSARVAGVGHALCWRTGDDDPDPTGVRLVPAFDPFVLAVADKDGWAPPGTVARVFRAGGWVSAVVLRGGVPVGVWRSSRRGRHQRVEVDLFGPLDRAGPAQLATECERVETHLAARPHDVAGP